MAMQIVCWARSTGERDYQECNGGEDVRQCLNEIVKQTAGIILKSVRVLTVCEAQDIDEKFNLIPGRDIVPEVVFD